MPVKGAGVRSGRRPPTRLARLIRFLCRLPGPEVHGTLAILGKEDVGNIGSADRSHSIGIQAHLPIKRLHQRPTRGHPSLSGVFIMKPDSQRLHFPNPSRADGLGVPLPPLLHDIALIPWAARRVVPQVLLVSHRAIRRPPSATVRVLIIDPLVAQQALLPSLGLEVVLITGHPSHVR